MLQTEVLKQNLRLKVLAALNKAFDEKSDPNQIKDDFATAIANAIGEEIDMWIKTGTVTVQAGIPVSTSGSPVAQTGVTTGPGTGTIA